MAEVSEEQVGSELRRGSPSESQEHQHFGIGQGEVAQERRLGRGGHKWLKIKRMWQEVGWSGQWSDWMFAPPQEDWEWGGERG